MKKSVKKEIENIIKNLRFECSIKDFKYKVNWLNVSENYKLSEDFIREFQDSLDWHSITVYQKLSEDFIREFQNKVNWGCIASKQKLSEDFIIEFQDKVDWKIISEHQRLSEDFIREFQDKVDWECISAFQQLSEDFIREFKVRVNWNSISKFQNLSKEFINEFSDKVNPISQLESNCDIRTRDQKLEEMKSYAKKYNLEFDGEYLYAFREHDMCGRGAFNKTIFYDEKKYYRDWHCDLNPYNENSFGLGIWPKGNTAIKVSVDDWGCEVCDSSCGKGRVWGFEII